MGFMQAAPKNQTPAFGGLQFISEGLYRCVEVRLVEIKLRSVSNESKSKAAKGIGKKGRIILGIFQPGDVLVG